MNWAKAEPLISPRRTALIALLVVAIGSRLFLTFSAIDYATISDLDTAYRPWAVEILDEGKAAYGEVSIEYPPAALPFVLGPHLASSDPAGYKTFFVLTMLIVDVLAFWMLLALARRRDSLLGPWIWTLAILALGPLVYLRLDLVPAVATIFLVTRADRDDWLGAGAGLGLAIAVKAYAVALIPLMLVMCPAPQRKRLLLGLGALLLLPLIPFAFVLPALIGDVLGYHSQRGIQIESLWGSLLFILRKADRYIVIRHNFGAHHFEGGTVPLLKAIATIATVAVAGMAAWLAKRLRRSSSELAGALFTTLTLVVAVATVFSPQFIIWIVALGAAATCFGDSRLKTQGLLLILAAIVTQIVYPTLHVGLVRAESVPIAVVWFRNLLVLMLGLFAAVRHLEGANDPSTPASASAGTP